MNVTRVSVTPVTDGSGDATVYTEKVNGLLSTIQYVKTDYTDGVDFTITEEDTGLALWTGTNVNAATSISPRRPTTDALGAASLYAATGEPVEDLIPIAGRIKVVIAAGGAAKTGQLVFTLI